MTQPLLIPTLLELLAKSALLLLGTTCLVAAGRRLSAAQQHALWLAVFAALLLLPLTKCIAPRWHLPGSPAAPVVTLLPVLPEVTFEAPTAAPAVIAPVKTLHLPDPLYLAIGLWLAGTGAILGYRLLGNLQIAWLRRRSVVGDGPRLTALARQAAAEMKLAIPCRLRLSAAVNVPCTWGLWHPVVFLPAGAETEWPESRLLAALRHEFAHVARRDYLARWVALSTCALYWPNPLVWIAARRLRLAQELACDDLVLRAGTPAAEYAALLVETARASLHSGVALRAAVAMARPSTLEGRVLAIVDESRNRHPAGRTTSFAGTLGMAVLVGASALAQIAPEKSAPAAAAKNQILITTRLIDCEIDHARYLGIPAGLLPASGDSPAMMSGVLSEKDAAEAWRELQARHEVDVLSSSQIVVASGEPGSSIRVGREYDLPAGSQPPKKFVGDTVAVTATADATTINLDLSVQHTTLHEEKDGGAGQPTFADKRSRIEVTVFDRSTLVVALGRSAKETRGMFALIEARKMTPADEAALAAPAPQNPAALVLKEWKLPPDFLPQQPAAQDWLISKGIVFPGGASAQYTPETNRLRVRNTRDELDRVEALIMAGTALKKEDETAAAEAQALTRKGETEDQFFHAYLAVAEAEKLEKAQKYQEARAKLQFALEGLDKIIASNPAWQPQIVAYRRKRTQDALQRLAPLPDSPPLVLSGGTFTFTNPPATAPAPSESPAYKKACAIVIPHFKTREMPVQEVIYNLRKEALEFDPEKKGVKVLLKPGANPDAAITLDLTNIPVSEVLRYVAGLAELKMVVQPEMIVLEPMKGGALQNPGTPQAEHGATAAPAPAAAEGKSPLSTGSREGSAYKRACAIVIPRFEIREMAVQETLSYLRKKALEFDPEKKGLSVVLKPGGDPDVRVTMALTNVPVIDVLRYLAGLGGLKMVVQPEAIVLEPMKGGAQHNPGSVPPEREELGAKVVALEASLQSLQAERKVLAGRLQTLPEKAGLGSSPLGNGSMGATAVTLAVKRAFQGNDGIEIRGVSGTTLHFRVGGTYRVQGVCRQDTLSAAAIYLGNTAAGSGEALLPGVGVSLSKVVQKGVPTEFDFLFTPLRPGKLHITLYDLQKNNQQDNANAGIYLGDVAP